MAKNPENDVVISTADHSDLWHTDRAAYEHIEAAKYARACRNRAEKMMPLPEQKDDDDGMVDF